MAGLARAARSYLTAVNARAIKMVFLPFVISKNIGVIGFKGFLAEFAYLLGFTFRCFHASFPFFVLSSFSGNHLFYQPQPFRFLGTTGSHALLHVSQRYTVIL